MMRSVTAAVRRQANSLRDALKGRFAECKLELHPQKTKIVYCKDANRTDSYPVQQFDFLGYTFRSRQSMNRQGRLFVSFAPAVSNDAAKAMRHTIRSWKLHMHTDLSLVVIWERSMPIVSGI
jgi:RNA-directed DNA polymerase